MLCLFYLRSIALRPFNKGESVVLVDRFDRKSRASQCLFSLQFSLILVITHVTLQGYLAIRAAQLVTGNFILPFPELIIIFW